MEGAVIGCVPFSEPGTSSPIPECYQDDGFVPIPVSETMANGQDSALDGSSKIFKVATSATKRQLESPTEPSVIPNESKRQRVSPKPSSVVSDESEYPGPSKKHGKKEENVKPSGDVLSSFVQYSVVSAEKGQLLSLRRSNSSLSAESGHSGPSRKPSKKESNVSLVGQEASFSGTSSFNGVCSESSLVYSSNQDSTSGNSSPDSSTLTIAFDNDDISPESSTRKRYLYHFRPSALKIVVKNKAGGKSFRCFICGAIYLQKFSLKRHYLRNHIDFRYISDADIANCKIPVPHYAKKNHMHMENKKTSSGRKKFKKSSSDIFLDNNDSCLMPGLYRCHDCADVLCNTESELKDHYNKHPDSIKKKFFCELCDASFFKKQILSRHLASHGKKKVRFECKKCDIEFPSQTELLRHANIHSSGKICRFCSKSLSTSANRKRHEALHLGLKPYQCTLCLLCFAQSKDLDRHLRKQHSESCRICTVCNKLFPSASDLDKHMQEKHSESPSRKQDSSDDNLPRSRIAHSSDNHLPRTRIAHSSDNHLPRSRIAHSSDDPLPRTRIAHSSDNHLPRTRIAHSSDNHLPRSRIAHSSDDPLPKSRIAQRRENLAKKNKKPNFATDSTKPRACIVCKRIFHTVYAMLKHKRTSHPYHSRKRRRGAKQKVIQDEDDDDDDDDNDAADNRENRKPYSRSPKTFPSPVKRGRPIQKPDKVCEKDVRQKPRPGPRSAPKMSKREKELHKEETREFYRNVADQIHRNLLYHIDGQSSQLSLKEYNFNDRYPSDYFEELGRWPWSHYNFPRWYDVDNALRTRGSEIRRPENLSHQDEFLHDVAGLAPSRVAADSDSNVAVERNIVPVANTRERNHPITFEERKKLIGKQVLSVVLCYICREKFESDESYFEHCINNHPNVDCNFVEIEGDKEKSPAVPLEMTQTYFSPVGFRFSCDVPPPLPEGSIKCTKCKSQFQTSLELHSHLAVCGDLIDPPSTHVRKHNAQRRIKNTMKSRMSLAQQKAALNSASVVTPEKCEPKSKKKTKYGEKASEKLQFYKNDRRQTTTLSVDKNYFNTKPAKPAKTASKRGRKSYAIVSSMYRNASIQPSTSRECSDCGIVFPTLSALNIHVKSHFPEPPFGEIEETVRKSPSVCNAGKFSANKTILHSSDNVTPAQIRSENRVQLEVNSNGLTSNSVNSVELTNSRKNLFPSTPTISSRNVGNKSSNTSTLFKVPNDPSLNVQSVDTPIDLSRNSCEKNNSTLDQDNGNTHKMSALQMAMDAVLQYSGSNAEESTENVHISKLQETVERITVKIIETNPHASSISKPAPVRKVGRPRKLKRLEPSTPLHLRKNGMDLLGEKSDYKPISKLEEAVKRLKENKVRSEEKLKQNSISNHVSPSENRPVSSQNKLPNPIDSSQSNVCQLDQVINSEEKPEKQNITADNSSGVQQNASTSLTTCSVNRGKSTPSDFDNSDTNNQSKDTDKLLLKVSGNNQSAETSSKETPPVKVIGDKAIDSSSVDQKKLVEDKKNMQDLSSLPSSQFSSPERPEKGNQGSGSHGRNSPTFDSILKVINQKLHSEEEESSHQDDAAITWLEDEKFEIPPSRSSRIIVNSELISVDSNSCSLPSELNVSSSDVSKKSNVLQENLEAAQEEISSLSSDSVNDSAYDNPAFTDSIFEKNESASGSDGIQCPPEEQVIDEVPKPPETPASAVGHGELALTVDAKLVDKSSNLTPTEKELNISPEIRPPSRRGPGRPRKKFAENLEAVIRSYKRKENLGATSHTGSDPVTAGIPTDKESARGDISINCSDVTGEIAFGAVSSYKDAELPRTALPQSSEASSCSGSDEAQSLPNIDDPDSLNSSQMELPLISLRTFRTKAKQALSDNNTKPSFDNKSSCTTEFGKSLASKMKEKMLRLSFEQDSSKTAAKSEEPKDPVPANAVDTNSQSSSKDKVTFKRECEGEPSTIHSCPYCKLEFAYLTNFRRHLKGCLARGEYKETDPVPGTSTTNLQHLPKKDEVDYSMLNLYRHQSRQTQMMKEMEKNPGSDTPINRYECAICHRIYLNLFTFLQHKITHHSLATQSSAESNSPNAPLSCSNEMNMMENSFDNELDRNIYFKPLMDSHFSENDSEPVNDPMPFDAKENDQTLCSNSENKMAALVEPGVAGVDECKQSADKSNASERDEDKPIKRKRGRPFGWRKNVGVVQEDLKSKHLKNDLHKNGTALYKRAGISASSESMISKLKANTKKIFLKETKKATTRTKLKSVASDESTCTDIAPLEGKKEMNSGKSGAHSSEKFVNTVKGMLLKSAEQSTAESVSASNDANSSKTSKTPLKSVVTKSTPPDLIADNKPFKRGRGRPPTSSATMPKICPSEPENTQKRRPGRPPKSIQPVASTSQLVKSSAKPLPSRNYRKTVPTLNNTDSSDSETELPKIEVSIKRKPHKICPICKRKFLSSLTLHRHIQLVHRRIQGVLTKPVSPNKISKKASLKSSTAGMKLPAEEAKSAAVDTKSTAMDTKSTAVGTKSTAADTKSTSADTKSSAAGTKSTAADTKSTSADTKSAAAGTKSAAADTKSTSADTKSAAAGTKSPADPTEADNGIPAKRSDDSSPKKPSSFKKCPICKNKFDSNSMVRLHLQAAHSRKSEANLVKPAPSSPSNNRSMSVKSKQSESPNRNALARQCRKSLPAQSKTRIKKQPPEQPKKVKL